MLLDRFNVSERRACRAIGQSRSTQRREPPKPGPEEEHLRSRLRALARAHPRYGYRRMTAILVREGCGRLQSGVQHLSASLFTWSAHAGRVRRAVAPQPHRTNLGTGPVNGGRSEPSDQGSGPSLRGFRWESDRCRLMGIRIPRRRSWDTRHRCMVPAREFELRQDPKSEIGIEARQITCSLGRAQADSVQAIPTSGCSPVLWVSVRCTVERMIRGDPQSVARR